MANIDPNSTLIIAEGPGYEYTCSQFFKDLDNVLCGELFNDVEKFKNILKDLNGENGSLVWTGTAAERHIRNLIGIYNHYSERYNLLISYFRDEIPKIFAYFSNQNAALGGDTFSVSKISEINFPKIDNVNSGAIINGGGLSLSRDTLTTVKSDLESVLQRIQESYKKIDQHISQIGDDSTIFRTRLTPNYAEEIKTEVKGYVTKLDASQTEQLTDAYAGLQAAIDSLS